MKKIILSLAFTISSLYASSQFKYKNVVSDFDGNYKIAYSEDLYGNLLKLENVNGKVFLYFKTNYICDEIINCDIVFFVKGEKYTYNTDAITSSDRTTAFMIDDLENSVILPYFLNGSKMKIRTNESHCENDYFEFNLGNSSNAFNFMK
jgi:hypothetical protein